MGPSLEELFEIRVQHQLLVRTPPEPTTARPDWSTGGPGGRLGLIEAVLRSARAALDLSEPHGEVFRVPLHDACLPTPGWSREGLRIGDRDEVDGWTRRLGHLRPALDPQHPVAWNGVSGGRAALEHARDVGARAHATLAQAQVLPGRLLGAQAASRQTLVLHLYLPWSAHTAGHPIPNLPKPLWGMALLVEEWLQGLLKTWKEITAAEPKNSVLASARINVCRPDDANPSAHSPSQPTNLARCLEHLTERCAAGRHAWVAGNVADMVQAHVEASLDLDWLEREHPQVRFLAPAARAASYAVCEGGELLIGGPAAPASVRANLASAYAAQRRALIAPVATHTSSNVGTPERLPPFVHRARGEKPATIAESRDLEAVAFVAWWFEQLERAYRLEAGKADRKLGAAGGEALRTWADAMLVLQLVVGRLCKPPTDRDLGPLESALNAAHATMTREGTVRARLEVERWQLVLTCLRVVFSKEELSAVEEGRQRLVHSLKTAGMTETAARVAYFLRAFEACSGEEERLERAWQVAILHFRPPSGPEWHADTWRSMLGTPRIADVLDGPRLGWFAPRSHRTGSSAAAPSAPGPRGR